MQRYLEIGLAASVQYHTNDVRQRHSSNDPLQCTYMWCGILKGPPGTGKTALICQYASRGKDFPKEYKMTVGAELSVLDVVLPGSELDVRLHILDTGGHLAQVKLMQDSIGNGHNTCCLVYSVTDKDTFASIKSWYSMLSARLSRQSKRLQGVLLGNKVDAPTGTHQVTSEMGDHLANELGLSHIRISAKKFEDAETAFQAIAQQVTDEYRNYLARTS